MGRLLRFAIIVAGALGVALLWIADEDDEPLRCEACGLKSVWSIYRGHASGPVHWVCDQCGTRYQQDNNGPLVRA
jgi:hypothetical protein